MRMMNENDNDDETENENENDNDNKNKNDQFSIFNLLTKLLLFLLKILVLLLLIFQECKKLSAFAFILPVKIICSIALESASNAFCLLRSTAIIL